MLKTSLIALATVIGASAALPSLALAIDKGPCDHCTMEPIVVKGDRKKTKSTDNNTQQLQSGGLQIMVGR
jgi:hypothetical protein